jgi:transcription initiation factor IIE alpha subunit
MVKQAKANGQKFTCDGCHEDLDRYQLTKNANDDYAKLDQLWNKQP